MFKAIGFVLSLAFVATILQSPLIANAERKVTVLVDNGDNWYQSLPAHHTRFRPGRVEVDPYKGARRDFDNDFFVIDVVVFWSQESVIWDALNELYHDRRTKYQQNNRKFPYTKWHFAALLNDEDGLLSRKVTIGHFDNEVYDPDLGYYRKIETDWRIFRISFPYAIKEEWYTSSVGKYKGKFEQAFDERFYSAVNERQFNRAYYRRPEGPLVVSSSHSYPSNEYSNADFYSQESFSYDKYVGNVPSRYNTY